MIPYKYSYFIGNTVFFITWLILFLKKPRLRPEMIFLGVLFIIIGPVVNHLWYIKDWWRPQYITNTVIGIEDSMLGFTNIGIVAVLYEFVFGKKYTRHIHFGKKRLFDAMPRVLKLLLIILIPVLVMFHILNIHSFWSNFVGLTLGGLYIIWRRSDLLPDALWSAILMPLVSLPAFWIPELLSPGVIKNSWQLDKLSAILILGAPLEDFTWYALIGFCLGGAFEFVFNYRIKNN